MNSEGRLLIEEYESVPDTCIYKRRWWILILFSLCGTMTALSWNTWGPIAESIELVFGWTDGQVALLHILGNVTYVFMVIPVSILMDSKGLRFAMILSLSSLVFLSAIRCVTLERDVFTGLAYTSAAVQGLASVLPLSGPPLLASVWFPVEERPTATAIGSFFFYFGVSMSFIVGPQLVPGPVYLFPPTNMSSNYTATGVDIPLNMPDLTSGISHLMYTHLGNSLLLLILVVIYFPAKPPRPPSITATIERTDYKQAFGQVIRNGPLWLISIAGGLPIGVGSMWISLIDVILKDIGVSQIDAGRMGFLNTVIGCLAGISIAKYSELFHRRRKICLAIVFSCAALCTAWFSLICDSVLPYSLPFLYLSCILIGIFINGTIPLFYELAVETSYPVGEGVTGGFYTLSDNVFGIIVLSLFGIPNVGITWINWTVLGALCLAIPVLLLFPERYKRSDIDMNVKY